MNNQEMPPRESASLIQRRPILKGAVWSMPVLAAAVAAPAAAASVITDPDYDLGVQTFQFDQPSNFTPEGSGVSTLYGLGGVTWTVNITNSGPETAPAGSLLSFGVGMGPYFDAFAVQSSDGLDLTFLERSEEATSYNSDAYFRTFWTMQVDTALLPGATHELKVQARLRRTPIAGYTPVVDNANADSTSKTYNLNTIVRLTPPDAGDRTESNNSGLTDTMRPVRVHTNDNTSSTQEPGDYTAL